ncbi:transcriptional regulator, GntR family [Ferrimonas balearica DSM 9799]|uniref:Transcriptional regulator, GntR family n=1 Tax=Ferrimonas balearica (strain DSM 9799 / CCM 4581 / KCTC 23876 / PAT) TaxID=550540 RepID=E1SMT6_FERBD|nr:GntR family transcriptional regulator [Ferrimonas balearica]MBY6019707.1 GntR family transcriptional regulator [Halomonas denitrificans]ADN76605.1 transcriptional regulator, GntR family [Ferrimonas balearica DSM 9799]MBW3141535.1 GntR family transcriptional regulator [Ferrimonas balearica]MBW3166582.1 GntR family transcriptional regulator [Ferrimonas balearica]MBY5982320.1 GntR family transcriptional regulator [Ferrimonas balearica]
MRQGSPIVHKTRTQVVVEVLREKILSGEIKAGEPLRQSALATELNVSRIPVREALLQLEAEGLVRFEAHKGATATELSVTQVDELFELRALIEPALLARSIPNLTAAQLSLAEDYLEQLESAFQAENAVNSWSELNTHYHLSLYAGADRPHTMEVVKGLNTNSDRYIRLQLLLAGGIPRAEQEHRQLLELCRAKDIEGATALLRGHIEHAAEGVKTLVAEHVAMQA